jgi:hypothetical protein
VNPKQSNSIDPATYRPVVSVRDAEFSIMFARYISQLFQQEREVYRRMLRWSGILGMWEKEFSTGPTVNNEFYPSK